MAVYRSSADGLLERLPLEASVDAAGHIHTGLPTASARPGKDQVALLGVEQLPNGLRYIASKALANKLEHPPALAPPLEHAGGESTAVALPPAAWSWLPRPMAEQADTFPESLVGFHLLPLPATPPATMPLLDGPAGPEAQLTPLERQLLWLVSALSVLVTGVVALRFRRQAQSVATLSTSPPPETAEVAIQSSSSLSASVGSAATDSSTGAVGLVNGNSDEASGPQSPPARVFPLQVGKLQVHETVLGHGSLGTIIFKGHFDGQPIAVKRMLTEFYDVARHEVDLLRKSDDHPNVVRYFITEQDHEFFYIGLELCLATLVQVIEGPSVSTRGTHHGHALDLEVLRGLDRMALGRDFMSGIAHLHKLNIGLLENWRVRSYLYLMLQSTATSSRRTF
jgi:hypothetical protein